MNYWRPYLSRPPPKQQRTIRTLPRSGERSSQTACFFMVPENSSFFDSGSSHRKPSCVPPIQPSSYVHRFLAAPGAGSPSRVPRPVRRTATKGREIRRNLSRPVHAPERVNVVGCFWVPGTSLVFRRNVFCRYAAGCCPVRLSGASMRPGQLQTETFAPAADAERKGN
jgi:hypothetical protein